MPLGSSIPAPFCTLCALPENASREGFPTHPHTASLRARLQRGITRYTLGSGPGKSPLRFCSPTATPACSFFPLSHLLRSPAQDAFADGRGGLVLEQGGAAALLPAVLLRWVLVGLQRGVLVAGSPAAAAGARRCLLASRRRRQLRRLLRRELLVVLERVGLARWRRGLFGHGTLGRRWGRRRFGGSRLLPAEVAVLGAQLVQPPLQLVDALTLGVDEALLVLHDGGELLQVEDGAHRVLQQALHAPAAGPGPPAQPPALRRERRGLRGGASPPRARTRTHPRDRRPLTHARAVGEGRRVGSRACLCPHAPRTARPGDGERGGVRRRDPAPARRAAQAREAAGGAGEGGAGSGWCPGVAVLRGRAAWPCSAVVPHPASASARRRTPLWLRPGGAASLRRGAGGAEGAPSARGGSGQTLRGSAVPLCGAPGSTRSCAPSPRNGTAWRCYSVFPLGNLVIFIFFPKVTPVVVAGFGCPVDNGPVFLLLCWHAEGRAKSEPEGRSSRGKWVLEESAASLQVCHWFESLVSFRFLGTKLTYCGVLLGSARAVGVTPEK